MNNKSLLVDKIISDLKSEMRSYSKINLKPLMGWYCTYVPEEIFHAAGFLPYRIVGSYNISLGKAKTYLQGNLNPFVQSCLESALRGDYDTFSGVVIGNADDATRRLYDAWKKYVNPSFIHILDIPKQINEITRKGFIQELHLLIENIEKHYKINITMEALRHSIEIYNETRAILKKINDLRKKDNPPITSNQFLEIMKLAMSAEKEILNSRLKFLFEEIKDLNFISQEKNPRLLLTGSYQDNPFLIKTIETMGGNIVCEDMCTRIRYFSDLIDTDGDDIISSLSKRYLEKPPCARMVDIKKRINNILALVREFKIDGIIYYALKFDDPYLFEFPGLKEKLRAEAIPVLFIESDHKMGAVGQLETRIQAFLETLDTKIVVG